LTKKRNRNKDRPEYTSQELRKAAAKCLLTQDESAANAINSLTQDVALDADTTGVDYKTLLEEIQKQVRAVCNGDLEYVEAMLFCQSHVLQSMSMIYTQKMASAEYTEQVEVFSRIALRAQNQSRQCLATLIELKNPKRATFIKQQNNAVNQQINHDGKQVENLKKSDDSANEILEELPHERLDTRTAQEAISTDQGVAAVEESLRPQNT
jgi:hypothetical protein